MVKVAAPMLSLEASGTIANSMTFSKWKGRPYVRTRVTPANPRTPKQIGIRAVMAFLARQWANLTEAEQSSWEEKAKQTNVSPFNAFAGTNAFEWRNGHYPSKKYPAARSSTPPSAPTVSVTGGQRQVTISITTASTKPSWGYSIHRSTQSGLTPSWTNAVALVAADSNGNATYLDTPLPAGTYYYVVKSFNSDGKDGAASAYQSASVT
jgi:hypothetical protein